MSNDFLVWQTEYNPRREELFAGAPPNSLPPAVIIGGALVSPLEAWEAKRKAGIRQEVVEWTPHDCGEGLSEAKCLYDILDMAHEYSAPSTVVRAIERWIDWPY